MPLLKVSTCFQVNFSNFDKIIVCFRSFCLQKGSAVKGTLSSQNNIQNLYSKIIKHLQNISIRNLKFKSIQNKSNRTCLIWSSIGTGIGALTLYRNNLVVNCDAKYTPSRLTHLENDGKQKVEDEDAKFNWSQFFSLLWPDVLYFVSAVIVSTCTHTQCFVLIFDAHIKDFIIICKFLAFYILYIPKNL